jgi:hypothetical protein
MAKAHVLHGASHTVYFKKYTVLVTQCCAVQSAVMSQALITVCLIHNCHLETRDNAHDVTS